MQEAPDLAPSTAATPTSGVERLCPRCGYDLRGTTADTCPECGERLLARVQAGVALAIIGCRLASLFLLYQLLHAALRTAVEAAQVFGRLLHGRWENLLLLVALCIPAGFLAGVAWFLWFRAPAIARRMSRGVPVSEGHQPSPDHWVSVGCLVTGLFILAWSVPELVGHSMELVGDRFIYGYSYDPERWIRTCPPILVLLLRAAIGLWLTLGSRGAAALIRRLRRQDEVADVQPPPGP